ncbi:hypothetical protein HPB51_027569 [Rhipicephalus microplus]|uniref:Uncharacterized protein n=1 Tax=Rhipicephalus microplus TaxID=6941 RepID=A0A9J6CZX5_RHIMP|nr:hypothetical protein HPB51_027569 [Rhipicephalus microplus]
MFQTSCYLQWIMRNSNPINQGRKNGGSCPGRVDSQRDHRTSSQRLSMATSPHSVTGQNQPAEFHVLPGKVGAASPFINTRCQKSLKKEWKGFLQSEGSNRKRRLTAQKAEVLRRMRIVQGAETLTSCTRDYLAYLEVEYKRPLQERTRKTSGTHESSGETDVTADLREVCGNESSRITQDMRPDGLTTDDQEEIAASFQSYLKSLFQEDTPEDGYLLSQPLADLCWNLRRPWRRRLRDAVRWKRQLLSCDMQSPICP